jgi:SAM-dependent methyltransferase
MNIPDKYFTGCHRILDVGGWFIPEPRATHVVDLMPWETRGATLSLKSLPGEKFTKATWFQADFLAANFRLPFEDKTFDLVICGHTIEDLVNPAPILREMERVGIRGIIECPSRIAEQTIGIDGRKSSLPGYHHHHWIVETENDRLILYSKKDSALNSPRRLVPLLGTERRIRLNLDRLNMSYQWYGKIEFICVSGVECERRSEEFVNSLNISKAIRMQDQFLRFARRTKSRLTRKPSVDFDWWSNIVEASRPYSSLDIP